MAAKRPWWHEIVAGLSTEKTPAARPSAAAPRPDGFGDLPDPRFFGTGARTSRIVRSPASRKKVLEWDPGSPAVEWVRRATFDGRAIAIRRAQDARGRHAQTLGITPLVGRLGPPARALAPPPRPQSAPLLRWGPEPFRNELPLAPARRAETRPPASLAGFILSGNPSPLALEGPATAALRVAPSPLSDTTVVADAPAPPPFTATSPPPPPAAPYGSPAEEHPPSIQPQRVGSQVTICNPPAIHTLPSGSGVHAPAARREGLSLAPPTGCGLPVRAAPPPPPRRGKGAKHARLCAGPWASALDILPPLPLTGAKRARAGLADVPITSADISSVRRERAACALAAILPWSAAGFILSDSDALVASRPERETTLRLVRALASYGVSSTEAAHSALGRLMTWVIIHHPHATVIEGSHVSDFLEHEKPSATTLTALTWLRDHCGLAIPARGPVCRPYRCRPPAAPRSKESLSIGAIVSLEHLATHHTSEWVRGQAAGWSVLARLALRVEQAQSCVINSFVKHEFGGETFTVVVGAVQRDKHPNPAKRRPRPVWGIIDGLDKTGCLHDALLAMLAGVERSQYLLRDTDSPDGDPTRASSWVAAPLRSSARIDASLHALLRLPPASLPEDEAALHHGHSAKRFLLNVAEASGAFTPTEACEVGRFSQSTAQSPDLEPVAAMLQAHSVRASVLPDIYAGKAKVARVFDLLARAHLALRAAHRALASDPALFATGDASWGSMGPFAAERLVASQPPLLLAHSE